MLWQVYVTLAASHHITFSGCNRVLASIQSRLGVTVVFSQLGYINISLLTIVYKLTLKSESEAIRSSSSLVALEAWW